MSDINKLTKQQCQKIIEVLEKDGYGFICNILDVVIENRLISHSDDRILDLEKFGVANGFLECERSSVRARCKHVFNFPEEKDQPAARIELLKAYMETLSE